MKLLLVIVNEEYLKRITDIFSKHNYSATIIASTGDFLQYGDTIFLLGLNEEEAIELVHVLKQEMGENEVVMKHQASELRGQIARITIFSMEISQYVKTREGTIQNDRCKTKGTAILSEESR